MAKARRIITLLTDFGYAGEYVGVMKGVILSINPQCQLVDLTHQIASQNILQAAFVLHNSYRFFPKGTIHLVVVDPGVGTKRRPIILKKDGYFFVGPDNGVFGLVLQGGKYAAVEITALSFLKLPMSLTFHGRDIFAPVAAHLSLGTGMRKFGPPLTDLQKIPWPQPIKEGKKIIGQIVFVDSFGNLITNIDRQFFVSQIGGRQFKIKIKKRSLYCLQETYAQVPQGKLLALWGSAGYLEIAVNCGHAQRLLKMRPGDPIIISLL